MAVLVASSFDYSALPSDVASEALAAAGRIRARHQRHIEAIIETGRDLLVMKDRLGHGNFLPWLEGELGLAPRTAQEFMQAATQFGDKCATVAHLPPKTVYQLAAPSTPAPVREQVVQRLAAGERLDPDVIDETVRAARDRDKEERRQAKLSPEQKKKEGRSLAARERREREKEQERQRWEREQARVKAARERVIGSIVKHFGDDLPDLIRDLEQADLNWFSSEIRRHIRASHLEVAA